MAIVLAGTGLLRLPASRSELVEQLGQPRISHARRRRDDARAPRRPGPRDGRRASSPAARSFAQLLGADGRVLERHAAVGSRPLLTPAELRRARRSRCWSSAAALPASASRVRLLATPVTHAGAALVGSSRASLDAARGGAQHLLAQLLVGGAAALLLASLAGYGLAPRRAAAGGGDEPQGRRDLAAQRRASGCPCRPRATRSPGSARRSTRCSPGSRPAFAHERRFLADASHELRTPLAILKAELELALRRARSPRGARATRCAPRRGDGPSRAACRGSARDRARRPGRLPLRVTASTRRSCSQGVAERFDGRARRGGPRARGALAARPARSRRIRYASSQALGNLLDNALRHGAGEVAISRPRRGTVVELHVRDDGPGFPPAFLPRRSSASRARTSARSGGGAGLGLAIVEAIAEAHGGSARAANRPAGGADVWIEL